jgi:sulfite exporter TauE/SafE
MCGPLAVAFHGGTGSSMSYQGGRAISYGLLGVALGGAGAVLGLQQLHVPTAWVAFVLAAGLVVLALIGERGVIRVPWLGDVLQRILQRSRTLQPALRALAMGLATPLLPCGLLWSACTAAMVAGSPLAGGEVMLGFALGSLPLLALAQTIAPALARRWSPIAVQRVQRTAMLLAAGLLVWRGIMAMQGGSCCQ